MGFHVFTTFVYGYFILLLTSKSPLSCYRCTHGKQNNTIAPTLVLILDLSFKSSCVLSPIWPCNPFCNYNFSFAISHCNWVLFNGTRNNQFITFCGILLWENLINEEYVEGEGVGKVHLEVGVKFFWGSIYVGKLMWSPLLFLCIIFSLKKNLVPNLNP
jgi:hypothetical protein